jgi:hypothetical protein
MVTERGAINFQNFQNGRHFRDDSRLKCQLMTQFSVTPTLISKKIDAVIQWINLRIFIKKNQSRMTLFQNIDRPTTQTIENWHFV